MNFFKSIILDEPDPPKPDGTHESDPDSPAKPSQEDRSSNDAAQDGKGWSFGGLIKTLATRSESVIETYSKDLKEFGSGLRKETEIIREAASRAVKDLPASLEAGTSAAHGVLDGVLKSTAEIISKEAQALASDGESETPETNRRLSSGRYSWFDAQLSAIQSDLNTFCEEPEDVEEYKKWKSSFNLAEKRDEIEDLIGENGILESVYNRSVPNVVDQENFWCRYYYRVDKLKQQEKVRANLVKRAISADEDDDDLSWEVDDDEEKEKGGNASEMKTGEKVKEVDGDEGKGVSDGNLKGGNAREMKTGEKVKEGYGDEGKGVSDGSLNPVLIDRLQDENEGVDNRAKSIEEGRDEGISSAKKELKSDERIKSEESGEEQKSENVGMEKGESVEKGDVSETSNNQVKTEEDLGWDEIEDMGSDDDKKISITTTERPGRVEVRKQLNAAEDDDEDFSWDIEDDDEPMKS